MNGSWTNWKISPSPSEKNLPLRKKGKSQTNKDTTRFLKPLLLCKPTANFKKQNLRYKNNLLALLGPKTFLTFRRNYVLFLSLLVMVTATSTEKYRCLFEQLEHYLGGITWGAKNDQVGVIFSVILLEVEISITASLLRL